MDWAAIGVAVAVVAVVLGGVAMYYTRKQHILDEGLKRAGVCAAIEQFLGEVSGTGLAPQAALSPFYRATDPNVVGHLFDADGCAYIAELRAKAQELWSIVALEATAPGNQTFTMKRFHLVEWMGLQESEIRRRLGCQKSIGRQ